MNAIDDLFRKLRAEKRKAFMPFFSAGDPDLEATPVIAKALVEAGANLIEVGFPYSDPIADGPVVQASYTRALDRGLHLDGVFAACRRIADECPATPLVAMTSYSLVHRRGPERFVRQAIESGLSGAIVPDLPVEEAGPLAGVCRRHDFKLVLLVTPTTSPARAKRIVRTSTGFVYCVSVTGITGERSTIPAELLDQLRSLRAETDLPLCVGFGVSKPEHVTLLRDHADGVIVGSAIVRQLEAGGSAEEIAGRIGALARPLAARSLIG
ncbi:MAG: tryptophan synthase subunit alpha [Gemmataceae bacterium]